MISITRLYCGKEAPADNLRYGLHVKRPTTVPGDVPVDAASRRPVVVWNVTSRCNLNCRHCYSGSTLRGSASELTTEEGKALLDDLAAFGVPAVLFSGGEPLMREDVFDLASCARELNLRTTLSTNGTLVTPRVADRILDAGFCYAGVSLDGVGETNDLFRGRKGAFEKAVGGLRLLRDRGLRVGLRMTLTRRTAPDLDRVFDLIEAEGIRRACFYHLCYSGRAADLSSQALTHEETRAAVDRILARTRLLADGPDSYDVLTVDNHADGPYVYLRLVEEGSERSADVLRLMEWNGGGLCSSGVGIADVDWRGNVHPDQFWLHYCLGNVRQRPFSEIWTRTDDPLLAGLRDRKPLLKGRCARCRFLDACGGSLRVRAELACGDPWAPDPACYLSDEEIGLITGARASQGRSGDSVGRQTV